MFPLELLFIAKDKFVGHDGVQDMLPPNMAPWLIEFLKLKESEKMAGAERSL